MISDNDLLYRYIFVHILIDLCSFSTCNTFHHCIILTVILTYYLQPARFPLQAFQTNDPSKFDHATLHVSVEDQNIHTPVFQRNLWLTDIQEFPNITVGSKVIEVKATDADFVSKGNQSFMNHIDNIVLSSIISLFN